jgi:hypothetical protein
MAREKGSGFRLDMGEPWDGMLADFCAAYYDASKTQVIREALADYIPRTLAAEPERRKRYEAEQKKRKS